MRAVIPDRYLFAAGLLLFGVLNIVFGTFNMQWQPIAGIPYMSGFARGAGAVCIAAALGLLVPRAAAWAAVLSAAALLLLYWVPQALAATHAGANIGAWLPMAENTAMLCGAVTVMATTVKGTALDRSWLPGPVVVLAARIGFGLSCVVFGLCHFAYADFTAQMIPAFIPFHLPLAYITGAGHLLAGLALVSGVMARLAAVLEAVMMSLFVLLVHVPMLMEGPKPEAVQIDWTLLAAALTMSASAWAVARALDGRPWFLKSAAVWQSA